MIVHLPSALDDYTGDRRRVRAAGATLDAVLRDLDRRYPGLRFRIVTEQDELRAHMKIFVNATAVRNLATPLRESDVVHVVLALSGG